MRTIAQISDLHFGRHSHEIAEDLLASVHQIQPHLVAFSGDFTQRARHAEFAEARQFLGRIAQPILLIPGNHDVPLYNLVARFLTPLAKYNHYLASAGLPNAFFHDDRLAVLGLNTARSFTRKNGRVSLDQIARIGRVFRDIPREIFKVLVTHHPLGLPTGESSLELAGRSRLALGAIAEVGIQLLLSGHHHRAMTGELATKVGGDGSILIVHAGTAISTRIRGAEGNSYNLIDIYGSQVSVRVMEWKAGQGFQENRAFSYVRDKQRWRPS